MLQRLVLMTVLCRASGVSTDCILGLDEYGKHPQFWDGANLITNFPFLTRPHM